MKTNFTKWASLLSIAALAFSGCSNDITEDTTPDYTIGKTKISATAAMPSTRVNVDDERIVTWAADDALAVVEKDYSTGNAAPKFSLTAGAGEKQATFDGEIDVVEADYYGVYPYDAFRAITTKSNRITIRIPQNQTPAAESIIDPAAVILVSDAAQIENGKLSLKFSHAAAYAQIKLKGIPEDRTVKSVKFTVADKKISGDYYYYYNGDENKPASNSNSDITIYASAVERSEEGTFNIGFSLFPTEDITAFSVTVEFDNGDNISKPCDAASRPLTFKAGVLTPFTVNLADVKVKDWTGNYVMLMQTDEGYSAIAGSHKNNTTALDEISGFAYNNEESVTVSDAALYWTVTKQDNGTYTFASNKQYMTWPKDKNQAQMGDTPTNLNIKESATLEGAVYIQVPHDVNEEDYTLSRNENGGKPYIRFYKWSTSGNSNSYIINILLVPATLDESAQPDPDEPVKTEHEGTLEDPFTASDAVLIAQNTGNTATSESYYVKGTISSITEEYAAQYGNATFDIVSDGSDVKFTIFRILYFGGAKWVEGNQQIKVGDEVVVYGNIINYSGNTPELNTGGKLISLNGKTSDDGTGSNPGGDGDTEKTVTFVFSQFGYSDQQAIASTYLEPINIAFASGGNSNVPKYFNSGTALRCYPNNTLTFTGATIVKVVFTYNTPGTYDSEVTPNVGSMNSDYTEWTGSSSDLTFTIGSSINGKTSQRRITKIVVTYAEGSESGSGPVDPNPGGGEEGGDNPTDGDKVLTFDFTSEVSGWPSGNSATNNSAPSSLTYGYNYTLGGETYSFALKQGFYHTSTKVLFLLKSNAVVGLPAIEGYKLTKVEATNKAGAAAAAAISICSNESVSNTISGGSEQLWDQTKNGSNIIQSSITFTLSETENNTMYYIVSNSTNAQISQLVLTYSPAN